MATGANLAKPKETDALLAFTVSSFKLKGGAVQGAGAESLPATNGGATADAKRGNEAAPTEEATPPIPQLNVVHQRHQSRLSVPGISHIKLAAVTKRHQIRQREKLKRALRLETTKEEEELPQGIQPGKSFRDLSRLDATPAKSERHDVGSFETKDAKWKAVVGCEIEKFMYPSLKLEDVYQSHLNSPSHSDPFHHTDAVDVEVAPSTVESLVGKNTPIKWEVERQYQNYSRSEPPNAHDRLTDEEYKRVQFDKKLDMAEGLLRKKEHAALDFKRHQSQLAAVRPVSHLFSQVQNDEIAEDSLNTSRYQPELGQSQQSIPRMPHTRKIMKQIQNHVTRDGQIAYYSDKQNLFAKWKKLQSARMHQLMQSSIDPTERYSPTVDMDDDSQDDMLQPIGSLSPRSLFFHECIKKNVLPEAIFSRINDATQLLPSEDQLSRNDENQLTNQDAMTLLAEAKPVLKKHHLALQLQHFGLGDMKTNALSKSLQHFHAIHVLNLSNNRLTDASILTLLKSLEVASGGSRKGNELRVLNLSQNHIGNAGCVQIARFISICPRLTHLDLSNSHLGVDDNSFAPLTESIQVHPALQVVNLAYNQIGERGGTLIGNMITQSTCGVVELNISWNQICRSGAVAIGIALRENTALKILNLSMNRFADAGGEQVAAAMGQNSSLTDLDLSRNGIGGRSAVAFGFYLRKNSSLVRLRLEENHLGSTGAKALLHTVALGSTCELHLDVHDAESAGAEEDIFDVLFPSTASPFVLDIGNSPYDYAVACHLMDSVLVDKRCTLSEITFTDTRAPKKPKKTQLAIDFDARTLVDSARKAEWSIPDYGTLSAVAKFTPPPLVKASTLDIQKCTGLITIIKRGVSTRDMGGMLDLALNDFFITTEEANYFVTELQHSMDSVEIVARIWPCIIDGDNAFAFLQKHLTPTEQRRMIDVYSPSLVQFCNSNPTGHWVLDLADRKQRKIALCFAMINAQEAAIAAELHPKRTDSSQYGKGFNWRNVSYNRKAIRLNYEFFNQLPNRGVLEFDYVSNVRHEDIPQPLELTDDTLETVIRSVGAEVCSVYIPSHKRKDLKYQLVLFHVAIANRYVTCTQVHRIMQYFPKNHDSSRFKVILSVHRLIIDLENLGDVLERLVAADRRKVYTTLGYLATLNPLYTDMDYEVDFEREDEKMLLRALVDLSMLCPMDIIRIEPERSDVLVIYSMYQTNSVPSWGKIFFRYMSHPQINRAEWLKARQVIFKTFLCGDRLRGLAENSQSSAKFNSIAE
ncbi:TPA: hypothetical protein N0F65_008447 [Lagenidium giganteum]|uniref:Uncharacterized protein n=1 Tax=Lagenidium giganteum TaxID=4803 RepID=A0AAV2YSR3_9STRA|nr:TPA: hypothetical protein N0F65_008447 [Lagenidium giganteum]